MDKRRLEASQADPRGTKRRKVDHQGSSQLSQRRSEFEWRSQAGRILKVRLKNFMNHAEFEYKPTERLNFLNGVNGSGKSAILTAIVFGLGGTARMSNRGASNSGLIRQGQNQTTVEISLSNLGENAYKSEVYGDTITVVRTVSASGASKYKLKDERGRIARDKKVKEELERILACFSIQVDNPIAILNQDASKNFLYKCDPGKLYEFFMKATQLEECRHDYNLASQEKIKAQDLLSEKLASLKIQKTQVEKAKQKYERYQKMNKQRSDIDLLKGEMAWAMVKRAKDELQKAQEKSDLMEKKILACKNQIDENQELQREKKRQKIEIEREIQKAADGVDRSEQILETFKQQVKKAREAEKAIAKTANDLERKKKAKTNEAETLRNAINKFRSGESEHEYQLLMEKKKKEIERLEAAKAEMEAQISTRQIHMNNLKQSLETTRQQEHEIKSKLVEVQSSFERKTREIKGMESRIDNKLFLFGPEMPTLVDMIKKNASRFKTMPIGPLGYHVELAEGVSKIEGEIIENELRNHLRTFLVSNFEDSRILQELVTKCNINVAVITMQFSRTVHNVSARRCQSNKYKTIMDRLVIKDPNVTNFLIDSKHIESVLIIPNDNEAFDLLNVTETVPKNCRYALTFNYGQYLPAPNCRIYTVGPGKNPSRVLQSSAAELLAKLKSDCEDHSRTIDETKRELLECQRKRKSHDQEYFQAEKVCKELNPKIGIINGQIGRIRSEETASKPPDVSALEEDAEKIEEEVMDLDKDLGKIQNQWSEAKEELKKCQDNLKAKDEEFQSNLEESDPLREKLGSIEKAFGKIEKEKDHLHKKIKEYSKIKDEHATSIAKWKTKLDDQTARAVKWSPEEIKTDKSLEAIHREINIVEESLKRFEESNESVEVVTEAYEKISSHYNEVKRQIFSLKTNIDNLDRMLKLRKTGFLQIRASVSRTIQMNFSMRLRARNFIGQLDFNHKENTLNISVCPQGGDTIVKRDLKGLSGGEKSYSTISLILAMWDCIQPPFRCLDEFDVFMDSVNRRVAIDQIVKYAKETRNFQYIFLTPLSIDSVGGDDDIQIVQLQKNDG